MSNGKIVERGLGPTARVFEAPPASYTASSSNRCAPHVDPAWIMRRTDSLRPHGARQRTGRRSGRSLRAKPKGEGCHSNWAGRSAVIHPADVRRGVTEVGRWRRFLIWPAEFCCKSGGDYRLAPLEKGREKKARWSPAVSSVGACREEHKRLAIPANISRKAPGASRRTTPHISQTVGVHPEGRFRAGEDLDMGRIQCLARSSSSRHHW